MHCVYNGFHPENPKANKTATKATTTSKANVKPAPRKSVLTRQRILDMAEQLFSEKGVEGTSLRAIAEQADMQAGNILHHFPGGKDELFNELVKTIFDQLINQLSGLGMQQEMPESLISIASGLWDYFETNPKRARIVLREAMEEHSEAFEQGKIQARLISVAAKSLMDTAVKKKQISKVDAEMFILDTFSLIIIYHSAPALRNMLMEDTVSGKKRFLAQIKKMLKPE